MKRILWIIAGLLLVFASCKKYETPPYLDGEKVGMDSSRLVNRKVLMILVDGISGPDLEKYMKQNKGKLANIEKLMATGKYSFHTLSEAANGEAAARASLMTGFDNTNHQIKDFTFIISTDSSRRKFLKYNAIPSVFDRLNTLNSELVSYAFMQTPSVSSAFTNSATERTLFQSEDALVDSCGKIINNRNVDFCLAELSSLYKAGMENKGLSDNAKYQEALLKVDERIGKLVQSVHDRKIKGKEEWLIILSSSFGINPANNLVDQTDAAVETFCVYSYHKFKPKELTLQKFGFFNANGYFPGVFKHTGDNVRPRGFNFFGSRAQSPYDLTSNVFNPNHTGEILIEFWMRMREDNFWDGLEDSGGYIYYSNQFLGKDSSAMASNTPGWSIIGWGPYLQLRLDRGRGTTTVDLTRGRAGQWNHYAISFNTSENGVLEFRWFINGVLYTKREFNGFTVENISNSFPLTFGFNEQDEFYAITNADFGNIRIWNNKLNAETIALLSDMNTVPSTHPNYNNLIGVYHNIFDPNDARNWKNIIAGKAPNLRIAGGDLNKGNELFPNTATHTSLRTTDFIYQLVFWYGFSQPGGWFLDGGLFLNQFDNEISE